MLLGAILVFIAMGFSIRSAVLIALLIVCPVIIIYGVIKTRVLSKEPAAKTKGLPLNWAAPFYDWYCPVIGLGRAFREKTIELADIRPGHKVLDVGCGTGVLTRLAAERVGPDGSATGIDPAPAMIGAARANAQREMSPSLFRVGVIEDLPFQENSFERVLSSLMLHHLPPDVKLMGLAEVRRVLKPEGRLLLVDIDRPVSKLWWIVAWPLKLWSHTIDQVRGNIGTFLQQAGFSDIKRVGGWIKILGFWSARK